MKALALRSEANIPFAATGVFYLVAIFGVLLPAIAEATGAARLSWILTIPTVGLYGILSLLVLYRQPDDVRARLFMFFGFVVTLSFAADKLVELMDRSLSFANLSYHFLFALIFLTNSAVLLHFAAFVPRRNPIIVRRPWLLYLPYIAGAVLTLVVFAGYVNALRTFLPWEWTLGAVDSWRIRLTAVTYVTAGSGILALLAYAARREESATLRRQALILFAGFVPWTMYMTIFLVAPTFAFTSVHWILQQVIVLLVPIACYISIVAYRLFEIGAVVRRFLILGITLGSLASVLYLGISAIDTEGAVVLGVHPFIWALPILLLGLGAFVRPTLRLVTSLVDRRFFHERVELQRLEQTTLTELAAFGSVDAIAAALASRLHEALAVSYAAVMVRDLSGDFYRLRGLAGTLPGELDPVDLVVSGEELQPLVEDRSLPPSLAPLGRPEVVSLRVREQIVGVVIVGPSLNDWEPDAEDRARLDRIGGQAAALLENASLLDVARNDPLTALPRRHVVEERIAQEVARSRRIFRPFAVAIADIDDFKLINDHYGHHGGDAALRALAAELVGRKREIDVVARYGGEEFVFLLPETAPEGALAFLEDVRGRVERLSVADGTRSPVKLTMSFGACLVASESDLADSETLLRAADSALYSAKRKGKNRIEVAVSAT